MEFFRFKRDLPFMKYALIFNVISLVTFLIAVGALFSKGLHYGIDFKGGTVAELRYSKPADMVQARTSIEALKSGEAVVQNFGTPQDVLVRLPIVKDVTNAQMSDNLFKAICGTRVISDTKTACGDGAEKIELKRVEFVGPQVGKELFESGALALVLVIAGIMGYLAIRFEWRFAVAAIIANLHDIIIILGIFAIAGWEFNLPVLAGVLAILGAATAR